MRRTSAAAALAAAALVALAGCSDDEPASEPTNEPSASTTASPSPTPTAVAPTLPPDAARPDATGAEAFTRYWFDLVSHAYASGDAGGLRALSDPECATCLAIADEIDAQYQSGGRFTGGAVSVVAAVPAAAANEVTVVSSAYNQTAITPISSRGDEGVASIAVEGKPVELYLRHSQGAWTVLGLTEVA